jgi:PKD repeat protein
VPDEKYLQNVLKGPSLVKERVWRRVGFVIIALFSAGVEPSVTATDFFVSPTGTTSTAAGTGTITNPWALQTALAQPATVNPGDTIWLRGGTYVGKYFSYLTGTSTAPIVVRSYPGEWAKIDSGVGTTGMAVVLSIAGAYSWFWGFEILSSDPVRQSSQDGSWPSDINRGACVGTTNGVGAKLINLVCHDAAEGFELWQESSNLEAYGNIIYNNGWNGATDRGHGHGIYTQNLNGSKFITDNIILQSYDINVQIYGSAAPLNNFVVNGNMIYQAAKVLTGGSALEVVFGGDPVATNAVFTNNAVYSKDGTYVDFGYQFGSGMRPATVTGNVIASSGSSSVAATFNDTLDVLTMTGNWFWGQVLNFNDSGHPINYSAWPGNTFIPYTSRPTGTNIVVRPNKYEAGRGHIAVFNWGLASTVNVDVSSILTVGSSFEVRNAQNFFGPPVLSGVYAGGTIALPMTGLAVAKPIGGAITPPATGPEFNAFVVRTLPPPPPVAAFTFSPKAPQTNVVVTFTDGSTGGPTIWQWDFGDGGSSSLQNPTHTYAVAGTYTVTLTARNTGGPSQATGSITVTAPPVSSAPTGFYSVSPCRAIDTRSQNGLQGGPSLVASGVRIFPLAGTCGIPSNAISVSANVTVVNPAAQGQLRIYPGNTAPPVASAISFRASRTRANNGVVVLATDGTGTIGVKNDATGSVHFVVDINGYFK